ncbi:ATP-dependent RNA helicase FAL1 [Chlorella vulgaris]
MLFSCSGTCKPGKSVAASRRRQCATTTGGGRHDSHPFPRLLVPTTTMGHAAAMMRPQTAATVRAERSLPGFGSHLPGLRLPMDNKGHPLRQYYVAVSSAENKLATLLDLLRAFEVSAPITVVACCGSRDSLDAVAAAVVAVPHCRVWVLHADLSEGEVEAAVQDYLAATAPLVSQQQAAEQQQQQEQQQLGQEDNPDQQQQQQQDEAAARRQRRRRAAAAGGEVEEEELAPAEVLRRAAAAKRFVAVLATTDSGLRALPKELLPLAPSLLVSYDLPTRKETYLRRLSSVLGSRSSAGGKRIAVNFAAAGQLDDFRQVEQFSEKPIEQMPVHVSDIFARDAA